MKKKTTAVAVQRLDPHDPFSQALAFLLKKRNAAATREKFKKLMVPAVQSVAVKIGTLDLAQKVTELALPVFTGTVSLYLVDSTGGVSDVPKWAEMLQTNELTLLFRQGYTLVYKFCQLPTNHTDFKGWLSGEDSRNSVVSTSPSLIESLEKFATSRSHGVWNGYGVYVKSFYRQSDFKRKFELAVEIARLAGAEKDLRSDEELLVDHTVSICRAMLNVLDSGKISLKGTNREVVRIVRSACTSESWWDKAKANREIFLSKLNEGQRTILLEMEHEVADDKAECGIMSMLERIHHRKCSNQRLQDYIAEIQTLCGLMPESVREALAAEREAMGGEMGEGDY